MKTVTMRSTWGRRLAKKSGKREQAPDRGDVVWLQFNPQAGHEQAGMRPAVVLSPRSYNARAGLSIVVPVTRQTKGYPFEVELPAGLPISGAVLVDQMRSVDWRARKAQLIGSLPDAVIRDILRRAVVLLS